MKNFKRKILIFFYNQNDTKKHVEQFYRAKQKEKVSLVANKIN